MQHYETRDLRVFSVQPLLIFPTHYTGEPGYVSDTETSTIWDDETVETGGDRGGAKHWGAEGTKEIPADPPARGEESSIVTSGSREEL